MKKTLINIQSVVVALLVLSGGFFSSCRADRVRPLTTAPKFEIGQIGGVVNSSAAMPKFDSFGIMTHKNAVPDSYLVQFKDEKVVAKGQNLMLTMDSAKNIASMVVKENQLKTVRMSHVFNAAIRGFSAKMTHEEAAILVKDPRVLLVEQDAYVHTNAVYTNPGWALDRIDQAARH